MNQRESSGLPLRAMVMVLLFLGVVFLLVAIQSLTSDDKDASSTASSTSVTSSAPTTTSTTPAPVNAPVSVLNVSDVPGAAQTVADRLHEGKFNVGEPGNLTLEPVPPATTVYFGEGPGEKDTADAVGKLLAAPVEPRSQIPELSDQPPGVVVLVTG